MSFPVYRHALLQLPSRLEMLTRLRQEKEEAAALKQDPLNLVVDAKQESLARLQALRQQQPPKAAAGSSQQQAEDDGPSSSARAAAADAAGDSQAAAAAAADQADGAGGSSGDDAAAAEEDEGVGGDPYAGMNSRQRKLYELKQKMQQARKANENAIIAERKRMRVSCWCAKWVACPAGRGFPCACRTLLSTLSRGLWGP
jgi:hypothetical protein